MGERARDLLAKILRAQALLYVHFARLASSGEKCSQTNSYVRRAGKRAVQQAEKWATVRVQCYVDAGEHAGRREAK